MMNYPQNRIAIVLCEGKSEMAYAQELNRLLREQEIPAVFQPVLVGTGYFPSVFSKYKSVRRGNPRTRIFIWVDWDIYARNDKQTMDAYAAKPVGVPDFFFSRQNFEDFLATHLHRDKLKAWVEICRQRGHLQNPLCSEEYLSLLKSHLFDHYVKGALPFELTRERIRQMLANQKETSMPLVCDFAQAIRPLFEDSTES
ncbi:MAG: hypothetical protein ACI4SG_08355 [Oligosphaeraceae bacterium]